MKLSRGHLRILLLVIIVCSGGILAALLGGVEPASALPTGLDAALPILLSAGAIGLPLVALLPALSAPGRLSSAVFFVVPLFTFAVFLTPHLDLFPIRMFTIIGLLASFAGTILVVVSVGDQKQGSEAQTQSRF